MLTLKNKERVIRVLDDDLLNPLARYVEAEFKRQCPSTAPASYFNGRDERRWFERPMPQWDVRMHLRFVLVSWRDVDWQLDRSLIEDVLYWANRSHHHKGDLSDDERQTALRVIDHLVRVVSPRPGPKVLRIFEKHLAEERNSADWADADWRLWPTDLNSGWLGLPEGHVGFVGSSGPWTPEGQYVGGAGSYEGVSLKLLPLDRPFRESSQNPALATAAKIIEAIRYPNSVVFLAVDDSAVAGLRESICQHRAWESTEKEIWKARDAFMPHEIEGAEAALAESHRVGMERMRLGYHWLLIPTRENPEDPLRWQVIQLEASSHPVQRAWEQLEQAGGVATRLDPMRLAEVLARLPDWEAGSHVLISKLALEFSRHLHLPRLKNWNVLYEAIAEALATPHCPFAFGLCDACLTNDGKAHDWKAVEKPSASLLRAGCLVKR